jgi:dihydroflavonol-4-reductase
MSILVTGSTGVAGYNLLLELLNSGESVRVLLRNNDPLNSLLKDLSVDRVYGDLGDANSVRQVMKGCRTAYHMEEKNPFGYCPPEAYHEINVRGSKNVFQAALERNVERVVHLSSAYTIASGTGDRRADETASFDLAHHKDPYIDSKREAEGLVEDYLKNGLEIVILNPGMVLGKGNRKSTLGRALMRFSSFMAHAVPGGATLISDAGDLAKVGRLLMREGVPGERYIAGTRSVRYNEIMEQVDAILGLSPLSFYMPRAIALLAGRVTDTYAKISGTPLPYAPSVSTIKRLYIDLFVSAEKATILWGIKWTPVREMLETSIQWLRENRQM